MASSPTSSLPLLTTAPMSLSLGTIINYISIKLDESNYLLWRSQFVPILVANDLYGYVDGSVTPLQTTIKSTEGKVIPNPNFLSWRKVDQFVLSCMNATLTQAALQHPVPDQELVGHALNGLGPEYSSFVVMMENHEHPPTFSELRSRLKRSLQHASHTGDTALLSTHGHISHSTAQPPNSDPSWYLDTTATSHMTADMPLLKQTQEYSGSDSVMVGNGAGLPISHTDTPPPSSLPTTSVPPNPPSPPPLPLVPSHPMVTRLKSGIVKPKHHSYLTTKYPLLQAFVASLPSPAKNEPVSYHQASKDPHWCAAMQDEFNTLLSNQTCRADPSMFVFRSSIGIMILLIYVNDIILTGSSSSLLHSFIRVLSQQFAMKDLSELHYFLGIEAKCTSTELHLCQSKYALSLLSRTSMLEAKPCSTLVLAGSKLSLHDGDTLSDPSLYRQIVNSFQYLTMTCPDITYAINQACQFMHAPTTVHLQASCKKQPTVARSSAEAEYRALACTVAEVTWLCSLLHELQVSTRDPCLLYCDNVSATCIAANPVFHARTKHIEIDYHFIRDLITTGALKV
uniref:Reverse transcriptase Ty1/copia-type domain-containing protein n=1 Tax=Fagus sylvatica TaxID=28930 RepID=A0A2N9GB17_FAGSY